MYKSSKYNKSSQTFYGRRGRKNLFYYGIVQLSVPKIYTKKKSYNIGR